MNKQISAIIVALIILLVGAAVYLMLQKEPVSGNNQNTGQEIIGNDQDGYGCIASAGYSWCNAKNKCLRAFEEICPDAVSDLSGQIKQSTGVDLAYSGEKTFDWVVSKDNVADTISISGFQYEAAGVNKASYEKVERYMAENFKADSNNVTTGSDSASTGYYGNYMACQLNFKYTEMKQDEAGVAAPAGDSRQAGLICGYFNPNDSIDFTVAQLIREQLALKYNKSIEDVNVRIDRKNELYAAGGVKFGQGGVGEGGLFLAAKKDNKWELAFDGNGNVDCEKMRQEYGFPDEILKPNFCD